MSEAKLQEIESALEALALAVVVLNKDDLQATGDLLEKVEGVLGLAVAVEDAPLAEVSRLLKGGLEKLIMEDLADADAFVQLLPQAVTLMQDLCRTRVREGRSGVLPADFSGQLARAAGLAAPEAEAKVEPEKSEPAGLPPDLDRELAFSFVSEALEMLQEIEVAILALEQDPKDPETINSIFRPFHTIKGVSGFLNLGEINHLAHDAESLLDEARSGNLLLAGPLVDLVLDAVDLLRAMISDVSTQLNTGQPTGQDFGVAEFIERIRRAKDLGLKSKDGQAPPLGEILVADGELEPEDLAKGLAAQKDSQEPIGSVLVQQKAATAKAVARGLREQRSGQAEVQAVKVDTVKLGNMVDMVGELVIALSLVNQNPKVGGLKDQKLDRDLGQLSRITSELQKTSMSLRMVPIKQTFDRMLRLVRDVSKKAGKKTELVMEGQETEIDRNVVEAIYDPLVHMIRNSVDHGVENPEGRKAAGKPEVGRILLRAYHQGGKIVIEIEDDGQGLDPDRILAKAIDRGLVSPEAGLSQSEIFNLVMEPGFSTAEQVTEISGRGVGMDVVKKAVENLRGTVEIASERGLYTRFLIRLPLTMAIIEGMIVQVGQERYIIPALSVEEVIKPEAKAFSTAGGGAGEMVMARGKLLPLVRLGEVFGIPDHQRDLNRVVVVILENDGRRKAVVVDELLGKQEVVIKSLGKGLEHLKGLAGGAILGDGRVGLILDVKGLFQVAERAGGHQRVPSLGEHGLWGMGEGESGREPVQENAPEPLDHKAPESD